MKKRLLQFLFATLMLTASSSAMSMRPREYTRDEKDFFNTFYHSCKQAIKEKMPEKDFQKTVCFAHIKGSQEAMTEIYETFVGITIYAQENCKDAETALKPMTGASCVPKNLTPYQIARDYIAYVDSERYVPYHDPVRGNEMDSPELAEKKRREGIERYYQSPMDLYAHIYPCKPERKNDRN